MQNTDRGCIKWSILEVFKAARLHASMLTRAIVRVGEENMELRGLSKCGGDGVVTSSEATLSLPRLRWLLSWHHRTKSAATRSR